MKELGMRREFTFLSSELTQDPAYNRYSYSILIQTEALHEMTLKAL